MPRRHGCLCHSMRSPEVPLQINLMMKFFKFFFGALDYVGYVKEQVYGVPGGPHDLCPQAEERREEEYHVRERNKSQGFGIVNR